MPHIVKLRSVSKNKYTLQCPDTTLNPVTILMLEVYDLERVLFLFYDLPIAG